METIVTDPAPNGDTFEANKSDGTEPVERGRSPVHQWIRFEEDDSSKDSAATIVPTQTIQVDSVLNTSHPLSDSLGSLESDASSEPKLVIERSSSPPHSGFTTGRASPKSPITPPPVQTRPVRKSPTELSPSRSSSPPEIGRGDNGHTMQTIPLSENVVHQRHMNSHGISEGFSKCVFICLYAVVILFMVYVKYYHMGISRINVSFLLVLLSFNKVLKSQNLANFDLSYCT